MKSLNTDILSSDESLDKSKLSNIVKKKKSVFNNLYIHSTASQSARATNIVSPQAMEHKVMSQKLLKNLKDYEDQKSK